MAEKQFFRVQDYSGGWTPDLSPVLLQDNEAQLIENFRIDKTGSLVSRKGGRYWFVADGTEGTTDIMYALGRWNHPTDPTQNKVITAYGSSFYEHNSFASTLTYMHGVSGTNSLNGGMFTDFQNALYYSMPGRGPVVYNGNIWYNLGVAAPAGAPGSTQAAGSMNGTYRYAYTYIDTTLTDGQPTESNPSPELVITLANQQPTLTFVPSTNPRISHIRIYRSLANGATLLFLKDIPNVPSDSIATTTDADGPVADLSPEYDNVPPPAYHLAAFYKGYMFLAKGNSLWWSKPLQFDSWPFFNETTVNFSGSDEITALIPFQDSLLIFGNRSLSVLVGDSGQWQIQPLSVNLGTFSPRTVVQVEGALIFLSTQGLIGYPGLEPFGAKLSRTLLATPRETLRQGAMVYVPEEESVWLSLPTKTYTVNVGTQSLSTYTFGALQYLQGGLTGTNPPLYIVRSKGRVREYAGTTDFGGTKIPARWISKEFQLDNPEFTKYIRRIGALIASKSGVVVNVTVRTPTATYNTVLTSAGSETSTDLVWGAATWGAATWSGNVLKQYFAALPAQSLVSNSFSLEIGSDLVSELAIMPPITIQYREANRFLGA